ncbi:SMC-Scp complex subunit ScpB [Deinococcus radiophilus]|uniref:SMC-Scp complex subunit ScpB n=1 Tax=Deinococcus radiophilus TaxID=32062 RepID=A0A3S0I3Z1_9DEIO|nr:SMC-Scp complex subunit ScpB [Deinococcus radiophilus]RTR23820.1 SMC-Scp complex subunit ScpB [Deinococcus radiophilus]UFA50464.1 SMC-Scp complex subunit ScpB [Deinococcus radiophilus]
MSSEAPTPLHLISAALLAAGRPVRLKELTELTHLSEDGVIRVMSEVGRRFGELGLAVERVAGGYRLYVPPELGAQLAPLLAPPPLPPLSHAALEVLAVIAYRQPVTRAEIEAMRGGSASTLVTLQERELVRVTGRSDAVGQPLLYGTTQKFLLEFGLGSLDELPPLEGSDFAELLRS